MAACIGAKQWLRWLVVVLVIALGGLVAFVALLPRTAAGENVGPADGIVALTGDSSRLGPAVELLEQSKGERLLITGVFPKTTKLKLKGLTQGGARFDCCADLGFQATDTRGNAREAADWAKEHHYRSLIVVTADYHMPRSLLEFHAVMPNVQLVPYAVSDEPPLSLWRSWRRWSGEYGKYVAAYVRVGASHLTQPN